MSEVSRSKRPIITLLALVLGRVFSSTKIRPVMPLCQSILVSSNSGSLSLGGRPDPASWGHFKTGQSSARRGAPSAAAFGFGKQTFLLLGTLSPNPWDLALYRQNDYHLSTCGAATRRQSWQPRQTGRLTGRIFGDPNWPDLR